MIESEAIIIAPKLPDTYPDAEAVRRGQSEADVGLFVPEFRIKLPES